MKMIAILSFAIFCIGCTAGPDDEVSVSERFSDQIDDSSDAARQAALLASKASDHIQGRQYRKALADIHAALAFAPEHTEYRFLYCLLNERVGEPRDIVRACYAKVVEQLSQGDDELCEADMNCVVADLMAEGAGAELRRQRLLAMPVTDAESEMRHYLLEIFDRDIYLNQILP